MSISVRGQYVKEILEVSLHVDYVCYRARTIVFARNSKSNFIIALKFRMGVARAYEQYYFRYPQNPIAK